MFDKEIVRLLALIHSENKMLFELHRLNLTKEEHEAIKFDAWDKEFDAIVEEINKQSGCNTCIYKTREERIRDILSKKSEDAENK